MNEVDEKTLTYIKAASKTPLLDSKREVELAETILKYKSGKNRELAIQELVSHNLKLVIKEAYRFSQKTGIEVGEFIGAGNEGLMKSAERFNPKKFKTKFCTYATYWIREAMQDLVYRSMSPVTIPVHISNGVARHKKLLENGVAFSDKDLMEELKVNEAGLRRIRSANVHTVSMNQTISFHKGNEDEVTVGDTIEDENAVSPSENMERQDNYAILYEALKELDEKSRNIIMSQFLQDDKVQLRKLGKMHSVTGERIRQISEKALKTLRRKIERKMKVNLE